MSFSRLRPVAVFIYFLFDTKIKRSTLNETVCALKLYINNSKLSFCRVIKLITYWKKGDYKWINLFGWDFWMEYNLYNFLDKH